MNEEFLSVLTRKDLILDTNFCLDRVSASYGDDFVTDGKTIKTVTGHAKINSCINQVTEKVGLLTFEDYVYAYDAINPTYMIANFISGEELEWIMTAYDSDQMWVTWYNKKYEYITISENDYSYVRVWTRSSPCNKHKIKRFSRLWRWCNDEPYVLISEQKVDNGGKISDVKVGDYVYIDESNNPYPYTTDRVTGDITYEGTKDKVRYRVVRKNNDDTVKFQRAAILKKLPNTIAFEGGTYVPFYYKQTEIESERCMYDSTGLYGPSETWHYQGCARNNIFNPTIVTDEYSYQSGMNIGAFLNNTNNGYYSWLNEKTKNMVEKTSWNLSVTMHGKSYETSLYNTDALSDYPTQTNDGIVSAYIGLPTWGDMYAGNDINDNYWLINRWNGSSSFVTHVSGLGYTSGYYSSHYWMGVRPVMTLKSNIIISSGCGTMTEPYNLKLN